MQVLLLWTMNVPTTRLGGVTNLPSSSAPLRSTSRRSFTPFIRIDTENDERQKAERRSLAEKLQQEGSEDGHGVVFPAELVRLLDRLEEEIRADRVSRESHAWLAQCGLTVEQLARQVEPEYTPARSLQLYHCDHRGLPLALISEDGNTVWSAEYDEWGNQLNEKNPHHLHQPYRLPGQQHDEESGLYYNRYRYYDPLQGRYITQDPIGLDGGLNQYTYSLNPIEYIDPLGLEQLLLPSPRQKAAGQSCVIDPLTEQPIGSFAVDSKGNAMAVPIGGKVIGYPPNKINPPSIHTTYANGSNMYRLDPLGHPPANTKPHAHAHLPGTGPHNTGQGASLDIHGEIVPANSKAAHFYNVKMMGMFSFISSIVHMYTFGSCKNGTTGQCFCAMTKEMEYNVSQEDADAICGYVDPI